MARKRRPTSVQILGRKFKIIYKDMKGDEGICDYVKGTIHIDKDISDVNFQHTLIHEILHGVLGRVGVSQAIDEPIEEIIVDSIATFLCDNYNFEF